MNICQQVHFSVSDIVLRQFLLLYVVRLQYNLPSTTSSTEPPTMVKDKTKQKRFDYVAAIVTGLAGIVYLYLLALFPPPDVYIASALIPPALFQLFWVIPMIRHWGEPWYYFGVGGTAVLVTYFYIRLWIPNTWACMIPLPQFAFIALTAFIIY